jgi:hypothetical protein
MQIKKKPDVAFKNVYNMIKLVLSLGLFLFLFGCSGQQSDTMIAGGPLKEFFLTFNELKQNSSLMDLYNLNIEAVERNDTAERTKIRAKFKVEQDNIIGKIKVNYPLNSLKLPFVQNDKSVVQVEEMYFSDYYFPWASATQLAYTVSFKCIKKSTSQIDMVRFEYRDVDNDIIMSSNCPVTSSGVFEFKIWVDENFYLLNEIEVSVL